ncbi:DUF1152 domain-containing protein [Nocardia macrotermitis]|uniref:DUF1152 domain-containing protein n=1 Tax=Nocardia macrotermitis TaxID=2585198 RepID=A0A7K0DBE3_9NOCA|nr:DUF1152 domain-containing protein [Nocardia macrotermitis]MQY22998.1 hypothetical protein [Nocardia macrotermitis]
MRSIAIAAGGGGDAVSAAMLASARPDLGIAAIMSYSWDRFMIDPSPGPRVRGDFDGLIDRGGVAEIPPTATLHIGQSTLPRLAGAIEQPLLLVEADEGAVGLSALIARAATAFDADGIIVVDVGGDILAEGHEVSLRSPLADSLALAAAVRTGIDTRVVVAGIGMDGELPAAEAAERLDKLNAQQLPDLTPQEAAPFEDIWAWHPSEANALLAAAASGWRGTVECQRNAAVALTDASPAVFEVGAHELVDASLAAVLADTTSLDEAEQLLRDRRAGRSELDIERQRAAGDRAKVRMPGRDTLAVIDEYTVDARERGVTALTVRRVAELVSAIAPEATDALRSLLTEQRPHNFRPPLYQVRHP